MTVATIDGSDDSGRDHLWPAIVAILLSAAFIVATVYLAGPPH